MTQGFEKRLFSWADKDGIKVTDEDRKRIIEFIKQNFYPLLSLTSKVEKESKDTIKITDKEKTVFLKLDAANGVVSFETGKKKEEFLIARTVPAEDGIEEYYIYPRDIFQGPGHRFVGPSGIILTTIYLILLSITIIYGLVQVWPPQGSTLSSGISTVTLFQLTSPISFQLTFPISEEGRLFIIVSLAGALGSAVHANRSFYTYVGERKLVLSWLAYYIILPISGAILGLIFYITVRGGLFAQATAQQTSPFGFAAVAALVGLFSVQALSKLEEVANTVFTRPPERGDSFKEKSQGETQAKRSDDEKPPSETKK